ncbi:NADH-quinone oxidoreductase subunit C [Methylobacillus flagellatus]|uniref:NADH-quinone oxidoreductase subunit C n=1 Tax=Methylobacillus flagellatus TaxID=405 RepID=UPI0010F6D372|nr:NADH-quinone oxidoreductase subunit C [Methylobacillus flagellatus]
MSARLQKLQETLSLVLGDKLVSITSHVGELTLVCQADSLMQTMAVLRDQDEFRFEQLIDLCGVDYADYGQNDLGENTWAGARYAVVYHLLSVSLNQRLRVRVFAGDDFFPVLPTMVEMWPVANWFEREVFDLYGIMFEGHPDLRRLLTDYGFVGHPFRKDFPMIGNVEMRYDPEQQRVIYQPVSIELRNNVPRVIRDEGFHHG